MSRTECIDLIEQEIPHLRRFALYLSRDPEFADDLVQDCLVRSITNIRQWNPGTNLRAWMFVVMRNLFLNHKRRQKLERKLFAEVDSIPETGTPPQHDSNLELKEAEVAFCKLSGPHREVLLLVGVEGLSYEEAANILDVCIGTIKSRVARARKALKSEIDSGKTPSPRPTKPVEKYCSPNEKRSRSYLQNRKFQIQGEQLAANY